MKSAEFEARIVDAGRSCVALRCRMASRAVTRAYDDALRPVDLKVTQFTLLASIRLDAFGSISEMADRLALERSTLSRNLLVLERRGLLTRSVGKGGRARRLAITPKGEALLLRALPLWDKAQSGLVGRFGDEAWNAARRVLRDLAKAA